MSVHILDDIPFRPDRQQCMTKLRVREGSSTAGALDRLLEEAAALAKPRALYKIAYVDRRDEESVVIDGVLFRSRVLRVNLENAHRVFAFLTTCGPELHAWMEAQADLLLRYYADAISEMALRAAQAALQEHLVECYSLGRSATMAPGSLPDWPIQQQRPLFQLLGDTEQAIGVRLLPGMLMTPTKTVSGIRFPTEHDFASCQLCERQSCPGRQAPYDPGLYEARFRPASEGSGSVE